MDFSEVTLFCRVDNFIYLCVYNSINIANGQSYYLVRVLNL